MEPRGHRRSMEAEPERRTASPAKATREHTNREPHESSIHSALPFSVIVFERHLTNMSVRIL